MRLTVAELLAISARACGRFFSHWRPSEFSESHAAVRIHRQRQPGPLRHARIEQPPITGSSGYACIRRPFCRRTLSSLPMRRFRCRTVTASARSSSSCLGLGTPSADAISAGRFRTPGAGAPPASAHDHNCRNRKRRRMDGRGHHREARGNLRVHRRPRHSPGRSVPLSDERQLVKCGMFLSRFFSWPRVGV